MKKIVNDLVNYKNLKIVQCKEYFNFSLESVLLPNFITKSKKYNKIIDLGCGNAPMPMILNTLYPNSEIYGVEIQKEIYELAIDTLKINGIAEKINILNEDINNLYNIFPPCSFDLVLSNPPYFSKYEKKLENNNRIKAIARHEIKINLEQLLKVSSYLLNNKGKFAIVYRTEKLVDLILCLRKNNLEPKRIRFIYPKKLSQSNLVLIEAVKATGKGIIVDKPLVIHNEDGSYTSEVNNIFNGVV